jgi:type IV pilus assembly protein PilB
MANQPMGIELVRRGIAKESDINQALEFQKTHPGKKLVDILNELNLCDTEKLVNAMGEILGEKAINLTQDKIKVDILDYLSLDVAREDSAVPFEVEAGRVKVAFADTTNKRAVDEVRLLFLNRGMVMDRYITFKNNIDTIIKNYEGKASDTINPNTDISGLVDSIIKTGMSKRASDIHIEPQENSIRVRYRIDGELLTVVTLDKEKQAQLVGRLKAISNMHQERQESQDGRILMYPDFNIRVSSQPNVYGEKFVLRLLKKNANVQRIFDLGFPNDEKVLKESFDKRNSIVLVAAPTGEGKTTTLYSIIDFLNKPEINVTTIEDPVEIRIAGLNQIEVNAKETFSDALRTVLRQDPDIVLVGEIRDKETAEIAMQAGQTGHFVLSTIHTIDAVEVITRLRKIGVSNYDISSTLATTVSQRLVKKICPHCARKREFTDREKELMQSVASEYGETLDFTDKYTYDPVGCEKCNGSGYFGRIACFEILNISEDIRELINNDASSIAIKKEAIKHGYRPLLYDGIKKTLDGITTLDALNAKLVFFH